MTIQKGNAEYTVKQTKSGWTVTRVLGGVKVSYHVPKEVAENEDALRRYIMEDNELF